MPLGRTKSISTHSNHDFTEKLLNSFEVDTYRSKKNVRTADFNAVRQSVKILRSEDLRSHDDHCFRCNKKTSTIQTPIPPINIVTRMSIVGGFVGVVSGKVGTVVVVVVV